MIASIIYKRDNSFYQNISIWLKFFPQYLLLKVHGNKMYLQKYLLSFYIRFEANNLIGFYQSSKSNYKIEIQERMYLFLS